MSPRSNQGAPPERGPEEFDELLLGAGGPSWVDDVELYDPLQTPAASVALELPVKTELFV